MIRKQILILAGICALACTAATVPPAKKPAPKPPIPAEYKVKFETTKGDVIIQVHHDWSPIGADHFYELVTKAYYDNNAFFRAMKSFIVQFGMNGDSKVTAKWNNFPIKDDPPGGHSNKVGTVTFAQTSTPNSRTTHIFINLADNDSLDSMNFTPFAEVISGMDVVNNLYTGYGDGPPGGSGPDQEALAHGGNAYLQKSFPLLDYIKKATVTDPPPPPAPVVHKPASQVKRPSSATPKN
jgi:cyclophilin family peptidyl-prolyl cis-trans isomerase